MANLYNFTFLPLNPHRAPNPTGAPRAMGFFDLNIPYYESDRNLSNKDKATLKAQRLKFAVKVAELGYTGVAYNREIKGVMSESDRCSISLFPLSSLLKASPSLSSSVKFHRDLLKVSVSTPFRQYTRLTVVVDSPAQASALNSGNPILKTYNIVAAKPMNQNAFEQACQTSEVNVIAIDFSEKLPFRLKQPVIRAAVKRGLCFEITYSSLIRDAQTRRQMISNAKLLVDWTRGKNLIVASAAPSVSEIRGPYDVANLLSLLGLPCERAKTAVSKNCRSVLANALRKKQYYKEAIKVEIMPSSGQFDSKEQEFDDWLKWDPISSGEGDLLLDDIEKSFSASANVTGAMNTVDFVSALNSLPSHGLQIKDIVPMPTTPGSMSALNSLPSHGLQVKDIISMPTTVPELSDTGKSLVHLPEADVALAVNGISEESLSEEGQASTKNRHQGLAHEDSTISLLHNTSVDDLIHVEENCNDVVAFEKLRTFKELVACSSRPEKELHSLHSQSCSDNYDAHVLLPHDETGRCAKDTEIVRTCGQFACADIAVHLEDSVIPSSVEESKISISFPVDLHEETLSVEEDKTEAVPKDDKELSLELSEVPSNQEPKEIEHFQPTIDHLGSSSDELQGNESHNQNKEENVCLGDEIVPMQLEELEKQMNSKTHGAVSYQIRSESLSGRGRRKRRISYQPYLSPFRNLLISKSTRKKFGS